MSFNYIEFQKNMLNTCQSAYLQTIDEMFRSYWNNFMFPERMTETYNKLNENSNKTNISNIQTTNDVIINTIDTFNTTSDLMKKYVQDLAQMYFNYIKSVERSTNSH